MKAQTNFRLEPELRNVLKKAVNLGEADNETEALREAIRRYGSHIGVLEDRIPA